MAGLVVLLGRCSVVVVVVVAVVVVASGCCKVADTI